MKRGPTGEEVLISTLGNEPVRAFVPRPLPPDPPLQIDGPLRDLVDKALVALGRLDSISIVLPDTHLFLYMYVRKEAVLSSQIEGTQASLSDLLLFELEEAPGVPMDDVVEVSNYVAALDLGLKRLGEGLPISNRLIREIHGVLLARGRGEHKHPGEFRRSQNWIGGTRPGNARFVPPPPDRILDAMSALERFLHDMPEKTPVLIKAALAHVQFETIHPFLDGNGRVGRILIPLLLHADGVLRNPLLYLSLYFKRRRSEYYDLLNGVRIDGNWESWLRFFAEGVQEMAENAVQTAKALLDVSNEDQTRIEQLGRLSGSCLQVHHALKRRPVNTIAGLSRDTSLSLPTVTTVLRKLEEMGLVRETTGHKRNRVFTYARYLDILVEGTVP